MSSKLAKKQKVSGGFGDKFNLSMLLYGNPGSGKTVFAGSYTKAPTHIYLTDPAGSAVLRKNTNEITEDQFTAKSYQSFWSQLQEDEKAGLFDELLDVEGLLVIDSYTTLENMMVEHVAVNRLGKKKQSGGALELQRQDWPLVSSYVLAFWKAIASLPCAVLVLCHQKIVQDGDSSIFSQPSIIGQQATQAPRWVSEFMQASLSANKQTIRFQGNPKKPAASRLFLPNEGVTSLVNPSVDDLYYKFHGKDVMCKKQ